MKVIRDLFSVTHRFLRPVVAVGNFDGLHLGHQAIIRAAVERAQAIGGTSLVVTFNPHPQQVLQPRRELRLLLALEAKLHLLKALGVEVATVVEFTKDFADLSPAEFATRILAERLAAKEVHVGQDFAFGRGRTGTVEDLRLLGAKRGFSVHLVPDVVVNGLPVSSSTIRRQVEAGAVEAAAQLLGRAYTLEGQVVPGAGRGRGLGFPTANLELPKELLPRSGIYAVHVTLQTQVSEAVAYIGTNPTFGPGGPLVFEVHLFGTIGPLSGQRLLVAFISRLRDDRAFEDTQALTRQISVDIEQARQCLPSHSVTDPPRSAAGKVPANSPECS